VLLEGNSVGMDPKDLILPWETTLPLTRGPLVPAYKPIFGPAEWNDTTGRLVQPLLRRALEMRRQIARDGWWNLGAATAGSTDHRSSDIDRRYIDPIGGSHLPCYCRCELWSTSSWWWPEVPAIFYEFLRR
jgi:hypothetical protein